MSKVFKTMLFAVLFLSLSFSSTSLQKIRMLDMYIRKAEPLCVSKNISKLKIVIKIIETKYQELEELSEADKSLTKSLKSRKTKIQKINKTFHTIKKLSPSVTKSKPSGSINMDYHPGEFNSYILNYSLAPEFGRDINLQSSLKAQRTDGAMGSSRFDLNNSFKFNDLPVNANFNFLSSDTSGSNDSYGVNLSTKKEISVFDMNKVFMTSSLRHSQYYNSKKSQTGLALSFRHLQNSLRYNYNNSSSGTYHKLNFASANNDKMFFSGYDYTNNYSIDTAYYPSNANSNYYSFRLTNKLNKEKELFKNNFNLYFLPQSSVSNYLFLKNTYTWKGARNEKFLDLHVDTKKYGIDNASDYTRIGLSRPDDLIRNVNEKLNSNLNTNYFAYRNKTTSYFNISWQLSYTDYKKLPKNWFKNSAFSIARLNYLFSKNSGWTLSFNDRRNLLLFDHNYELYYSLRRKINDTSSATRPNSLTLALNFSNPKIMLMGLNLSLKIGSNYSLYDQVSASNNFKLWLSIGYSY